MSMFLFVIFCRLIGTRPFWLAPLVSAGFALFTASVYEWAEEISFVLRYALGLSVVSWKGEYDVADTVLWDPLAHLLGVTLGLSTVYYFGGPPGLLPSEYYPHFYSWRIHDFFNKIMFVLWWALFLVVFPLSVTILPNLTIKGLEKHIDHDANIRWDFMIVTLVRMTILILFIVFLIYKKSFIHHMHRKLYGHDQTKELFVGYTRMYVLVILVVLVLSVPQFFQYAPPALLLVCTIGGVWVLMTVVFIVRMLMPYGELYTIKRKSASSHRMREFEKNLYKHQTKKSKSSDDYDGDEDAPTVRVAAKIDLDTSKSEGTTESSSSAESDDLPVFTKKNLSV